MKLEQHLISRGMDVGKYQCTLDEDMNIATFYLYNLSGQLVGYHTYRPDKTKERNNDPKEGRYFTLCKDGKLAVFGLECLNENDRRIFVVEGIFKAAMLHRLGYNAIAVLGATPKPLKNWFYMIRKQWDLIAIGDNDDAGRQLVNMVGRGFQSPSDVDEMEDEEIHKMIESFS